MSPGTLSVSTMMFLPNPERITMRWSIHLYEVPPKEYSFVGIDYKIVMVPSHQQSVGWGKGGGLGGQGGGLGSSAPNQRDKSKIMAEAHARGPFRLRNNLAATGNALNGTSDTHAVAAAGWCHATADRCCRPRRADRYRERKTQETRGSVTAAKCARSDAAAARLSPAAWRGVVRGSQCTGSESVPRRSRRVAI
jgi:hypothetical protein